MGLKIEVCLDPPLKVRRVRKEQYRESKEIKK